MRPLPTYRDPMLTRIHSTIRAMRQAQRRETFRTLQQAEAALDAMACDGTLEPSQRITRQHDLFVIA